MADSFEDEQPLDPVLENVRRKLQRLMLISFGIMGFGLMALLAVIIYKLTVGNQDENTQVEPGIPGTPVEAVLELPDGARITETHLEGNRILVTVRHQDGAMSLWVIDADSGQLISRIQLQNSQ